MVARNMWIKEVNLLRKIVHKVGFTYKMGMGNVVPNVERGQTVSSFEM